jgi:DNA ligase-associated metallophosphoesterase
MTAQAPAQQMPIFASRLAIAGMTFLADPSGALYCEGEATLLVADLHFEKGSSQARRGQLLPPFDTAATLARLAAVVTRYRPCRIIALGDSFHDPAGPDRLSATDRARLAELQADREWIWLSGNHDPRPPSGCAGVAADAWRLGRLALRHVPSGASLEGEIAGHLHPVARLSRGRAMRRRCFLSDGMCCILPAFGAYAGGLNVRDRAFAGIFAAALPCAYVLGADRLYRLPLAHCLPD